MYQGTVYCKVHFLELFRVRGTYDFKDDNGSNAPAFGARKKAKSSPSGSVSESPSSSAGATKPSATPQKAKATATPAAKAPPKQQVQSYEEDGPSNSEADRGVAGSNAGDEETAEPEGPIDGLQNEVEPKVESDSELSTSKKTKGNSKMASLLDAIRRRDSGGVEKCIKGDGIELMFEKGPDGITPIQYAFTTDSIECGRCLLDVIDKEIQMLRQ